MYRFEDEPYDLVRCRCGFVFVNPRQDPPSIARMYDDPDYYTHGYNLGVETQNYFLRKEELVAQYERTARRPLGGARGRGRSSSSAPRRLLPRGRAAREIPRARRRALAAGLRLLERSSASTSSHGQLEDAPFPAGSFDVAYADNVLEHTTAPERSSSA
jgi:hypothetical protein